MSEATIQTVTGPIPASQLGRTLMHEHLVVGYPGAESHTTAAGPSREDMIAICCDEIGKLEDHGVTSMLDPCPNDLGRDVELMASVAQKTGFQVVCATGLYKQAEGGYPYWKFRGQFGDVADSIAELFIAELQEGIGDTGIRAGIIKVASGKGEITAYEETVLRAAAMAAVETGAPITTHTDSGTMGDEQQRILVENGVAPHRIIIGHSCGTSDHDYHMKIVRGGSYLGFDRFGIDVLQPDEQRIAALLRLIAAGATSRVVVSHDSVWCWRGQPIPTAAIMEAMTKTWNATHFFEQIVPRLLEGGATAEDIETLLVDNPQRFFSGGTPPNLG